MSERGGAIRLLRPPGLSSERPTGLYTLVVMKFTRNRVALFGLACLLLILLAIIFAPQVTPYDPIQKGHAGAESGAVAAASLRH